MGEYINQNIYITNDEEIKKGDWCFEMYNGESKATTSNFVDEKGNRWWLRQMNMYCSVNDPECKKIILTTDQDLIKDGVQDIPDEFLEWFVKNPSCEEVEVKSEILYEHKDTYRPYPSDCKNLSKTKVNYYLSIIPKEEPKKEYQTCKCGSNWFNTTVDDKPFCFKCGESVKKDFKPTEEDCSCTDECLGYLTKTCKGIEEVALRLYPNRESFLDRFQDIEREAFIKGYKLAQEKIMTPKKEAENLINEYRMILMNADTECGNEILCTSIAKKCALVTVGKIEKMSNYSDFWNEVKNEIKKL